MDWVLLWIVVISVLGPVIGSFIGVLKKPSDRFMYNMLSFAGGVMLAISFLELIPHSIEMSSIIVCLLGIISGAILMFGIDRLMPHIHPSFCTQEQGHNLKKTALYLIIGIFIHNIPEGMAIAIGAVTETKMSFVIALAIAIHNIPEGICTSAPYYRCTKNRLKSFLVSSSTAIPILIGFFVTSWFYNYISKGFVGFIVAVTAGLMIYITSDEIIPTSCSKLSNHTTIFSLVAGILFVIGLGMI
ncbi:MAG TPA: ZIP family metal transporter [Candidatus Woesearchaeota archaeon]|nr:ZIP family metal transporter [Candidatus Woesearchaeota archaeon]